MYFFYEMLMIMVDHCLIKEATVSFSSEYMHLLISLYFIVLYFNFLSCYIATAIMFGFKAWIDIKMYENPVDKTVSNFVI